MEKKAARNPKSLIYKIFLAILLVGMHGECQFGSFNFFGANMQYSSVEFVIGFSILFLCGYILYEKVALKEVFREKTLFWILSLFCLSLVLSTIFARYKVEAIKYDIRIMVTIALFFLLLQFLSNEGLKGFCLVLLNVVGVGVCLICILKYFNVAWVNDTFSRWGIGSRTIYSASVFQHNNVFGNWLVLLMLITIGQFKNLTPKRYRILLVGSTGLFFFTLPLTLSRSAWVAFVVAVVVGGIYLWWKRRDRRAVRWAGLLALIFCMALGSNSSGRQRVSEIVNRLVRLEVDSSSEERVEVWRAALNVWTKYPIVGIGLNNYKNTHYEFSSVLHNEQYNAHNQYVNILAEQGIFGFVVFMGFVGYLVAMGVGNIRRGGNEFYALAIFAYLIGALFDYLWYDYSFIFMFWFVVILNIIEKRRLELRN